MTTAVERAGSEEAQRRIRAAGDLSRAINLLLGPLGQPHLEHFSRLVQTTIVSPLQRPACATTLPWVPDDVTGTRFHHYVSGVPMELAPGEKFRSDIVVWSTATGELFWKQIGSEIRGRLFREGVSRDSLPRQTPPQTAPAGLNVLADAAATVSVSPAPEPEPDSEPEDKWGEIIDLCSSSDEEPDDDVVDVVEDLTDDGDAESITCIGDVVIIGSRRPFEEDGIAANLKRRRVEGNS